MAAIKNRRGAILLEAVGAVALLLSAVGLCLEIIRRSHHEILLHHAAFQVARGAILAPQTPSRERVARWWNQVYGDAAPDFLRPVEVEVERFTDHLSARVHLRYPAWSGNPFFARAKSTFEVTRRCRFAFSP